MEGFILSTFSNLIEAGEENLKVITILSDEQMRTISAENYKDFVKKYTSTKEILKSWFSNHDPADKTPDTRLGQRKGNRKEILLLQTEL